MVAAFCAVILAISSAPTAANAASFGGNGWWWAGASQSGTGFFFETQNDTSFVAFFLYDDAGNAVWYTASGKLNANGGTAFTFNGTLTTCRGGQAASSNVVSAPTCTAGSDISIAFTNASSATVRLPARTFLAERFNFNGLGSTGTGNQPETGWYWNAAQNGRGYAVEVQNGVIFLVMFHYNTDGSATWNTFSGPVRSAGRFSGDFVSIRGGQTLGGAYRAPNPATTTPGFFGEFSSACVGVLTFPGNSTSSSVNRFGFALTDAQACVSSQNNDSSAVFKLLPSVSGRDATLSLFNQQGAAGYAYISGLANQTNFGSGQPPVFEFSSLFAKGLASVAYQYAADPALNDATQFLNRLNSRGAQGYVFKGPVGFNLGAPSTEFYDLFVSSTRRATYSYRLVVLAALGPVNLTALNQQGRDGYAYRGPLLIGAQYADLYVKDNTSVATYNYEITPSIDTPTATLAEMNARGAQFYAFQGPISNGSTFVNLYERASTTTTAIQYALSASKVNQPPAEALAKANDFASRGFFFYSDYAFFNPTEYVSLFYKGPPQVHPIYGVVFP